MPRYRADWFHMDYIQSIAPEYVQVKVTPMHGGEGYVCPITLPAYQAAEKGFAKAFGKKPLAVRRGGSIPIISDFEQILGIKTVLMGFGLEVMPSIRLMKTSLWIYSVKELKLW